MKIPNQHSKPQFFINYIVVIYIQIFLVDGWLADTVQQ